MSIVSMITNAITPTLADQIGKQLGVSSAVVQKGLKAIIPVLLAAILGQSKKSDGASALSSILDTHQEQQPGLFDDLVGAISGNSSAVSTGGMNALNTLLGGSATDRLTSKLSAYAGVPADGANQLLGLGAATVMGALGKTSREQNLDAAGLLQSLAAEKDDIAKAVPADLAKELSGTGLLDSLPKALAAAPASAERAVASTPAPRRSLWPWIVAAAVILILLYVLPGFFRSDTVETGSVDAPAAATEASTFAANSTSGVDTIIASPNKLTAT